jgi:hypothetical protein
MRLSLLLIFAALTGCTSTTNYSFDVNVTNKTSHPLTIGFTKTGPPFEPRWASPENLTEVLPRSRQPLTWGRLLGPGGTGQYHLSGEFERGAYAVLRVYSGDRPFDELLAISRGTPGRIDLTLVPGNQNTFELEDEGGKLTSKLIRAAAVVP